MFGFITVDGLDFFVKIYFSINYKLGIYIEPM